MMKSQKEVNISNPAYQAKVYDALSSILTEIWKKNLDTTANNQTSLFTITYKRMEEMINNSAKEKETPANILTRVQTAKMYIQLNLFGITETLPCTSKEKDWLQTFLPTFINDVSEAILINHKIKSIIPLLPLRK